MTAYAKLLTLALVANGLLAGLYFVFAVAVCRGLGRLADPAYVAAFRSINEVIQNGWFLSVFFLGPVAAVAAAAVGGIGQRPGCWWTVGGAACAVLTFLITVAANVPLNDALAAASTTTDAQVHAARAAFEHMWNRWNLARTLTGLAALVLLSVAAVNPGT